MSAAARLRLFRDLSRSEGSLALRDRLLDRFAELRRRHRFAPAAAGRPLPAVYPVLTFLPTPPAVWLGGVQTQLLARLEAAHRSGRATALLYPDGAGRFRLETAFGSERRALTIAAPASSGSVSERPGAERAIATALAACGASILHVENLGELPPRVVLAAGRFAKRLVLSVHDFSLFCLRPHLFEQPHGRFCEYSRDMQRCARCLRRDWPVQETFQAERRRSSAELIGEADAVVFPSAFLRDVHLELFPELDPGRARIVAPALAAHLPRAIHRRRRGGTGELHVASIGGGRAHKGGEVLEELVTRLNEQCPGCFLWTVFGGGGGERLRRLRRSANVRVRGYYRSGTLPRLLAASGVDVALPLSVVPESYSLALDEAVLAGVPVIAFDQGAVGERIRRDGGGVLVPFERGAGGIEKALTALRDRPAALAALRDTVARREWSSGGRASEAIETVYRELELD